MQAGKQDISSGAGSDLSAARIGSAVESISQIVRDKEEVIKSLMVGFLARGHVLIEDVPGVGKTTIARCLARVLGGQFSRVQLTSDLLPVDIVGGQLLDAQTKQLVFHRGPIFANIVLADELNRATPRTQSGLLEAMAERSVTIDGQTHTLSDPFMVIATQNPTEHHGVYPLPESQLDRFLLRIDIGYPDAESETSLIREGRQSGVSAGIEALEPLWSPAEVQTMFQQVEQIRIHEEIATYLQMLVQSTREHDELITGVSTRGILAFASALRARAYIEERDYVTPDDVKSLFMPVCTHRVMVRGAGNSGRALAEGILQEILNRVPVPV